MARFPEFRSFQEFWPFYVGEHRTLGCRLLHYAGAIVAVALSVAAIASGMWLWIPAAVLLGYAFAWTGHFLVEHNVPATWGYVRWSFLAEFKMLWLGLTGQMGREVTRHCGSAADSGSSREG